VFTGIFETLGSILKAPVNFMINAINSVIGALNSINITVPDWPILPPGIRGQSIGFNIPTIPMLAQGTDFHRGGPAIVGEKGPELVNLPRGAQVIPNDDTNKILKGLVHDRQGTRLLAAIQGVGSNITGTTPASSPLSTRGVRTDRRKSGDSYPIRKYDDKTHGTRGIKAVIEGITQKFEIKIDKLVIGGADAISPGGLSKFKEELKAMFKEIFGELWEEAWYELTLKYPNMTEA
jgi:hypothetical protein